MNSRSPTVVTAFTFYVFVHDLLRRRKQSQRNNYIMITAKELQSVDAEYHSYDLSKIEDVMAYFYKIGRCFFFNDKEAMKTWGNPDNSV
jgi:hypothetical protein